jgi:hypothetical protein
MRRSCRVGQSLCGGWRDEAVLQQHFDPPRRVTLDGDGLLVDGAVLIVGVADEQGIDDEEPLMRQGPRWIFCDPCGLSRR